MQGKLKLRNPTSTPGVLLVRLCIHVFFIAAGTCFLLALLVALGGVAIWFGLRTVAGFKLAAELAGAGAGALLLGFLVHVVLDHWLGRGAPARSAAAAGRAAPGPAPRESSEGSA